MAKKRGFFAELQHQNQVAARRRQQESVAASRAHAAAAKQAEQAAAQWERAQARLARASVAEQKEAEREAKRLHEAAQLAEVEALNAELASQFDAIDGLLAATLDVDDFVDLEQLREVVVHPAFSQPGLELPVPRPSPLVPPAEPLFAKPEGEPKGLSGVFGAKKKYAEVVAQAEAEFERAHATWQAEMEQLPVRQAAQDQEYERVDAARRERLAAARAEYEAACREREQAVAESNARLDTLIANLGYDVEEAVQEYVSIVLGNSVYPECFAVEHDFQFDASLRELTLTASVPGPADLPSVREYKYVKARDEITSTALPIRDQKDRYASAVSQVALRTLQEIFEADRAGKIHTVTLTMVTQTVAPTTGRLVSTPLVAVAAERDTFMSFDLSNVVPAATLQHLGGLISKSPFDLVPIDTSKGVRGR